MSTNTQSLVLAALVVPTLLALAACSESTQSTPVSPSALFDAPDLTNSGAAAAGGSGSVVAQLGKPPGVGGGPEMADVGIQGGGGVYAPNGATLVRQANGLRVSMRVPTPPPGTYSYPAGLVAGHPEVFTLWAFVFNRPDLCTNNECSADDVDINAPAEGGAYNIGGHTTGGGGTLNISGRVAVGQPAGAPGGGTGSPLRLPATAEVHVALAPHGALDPSTLPGEFRMPTGPSSLWWVAFFFGP